MDAYQKLQTLDSSRKIGEDLFNELKAAFAESYLLDKNYAERLELHRNPHEVKNELLTDLNTYLQKLQQREEMRDIDLEKNSSGYVPTKVAEIWRADKRLDSDYEAIERYCKLRSRDFNTTAVHMAEYKALSGLFTKVQDSMYINQPSAPIIPQVSVGKTVHPLNFVHLGWDQFEWLVYAYVFQLRSWERIEWLGQSGGDGGKDIWGEYQDKSYCYQCVNYRALEFKKVKEDIDKLVKTKTIPDFFIVVCGGRVSANMRMMMSSYAAQFGIAETEIWSAPEFEEKLRSDMPDLVKRFFEGQAFPEVPKDDQEMVKLLAECFDRPAFTTPFHRDVNILHFEKAITDTIEVLNTGVHRLRDGTIIRNVPTRHQIKDDILRSKIAGIYKSVVGLRDAFIDLKSKKEIEPCGCGERDCPVYILSDNACEKMDRIRSDIFIQFKSAKPDFNLQLDNQ